VRARRTWFDQARVVVVISRGGGGARAVGLYYKRQGLGRLVGVFFGGNLFSAWGWGRLLLLLTDHCSLRQKFQEIF
jgi:hypothetical protein